ncbi:DUF3325 domain-containing protein [Rhodopseudomonas palustris]|uniref:DUF3325 domain-containing protein n=1 Tax=Rhodopseudomonas palustris (strain ATCC BAA-98 / CGA009) TaxID=258594 RepID=Q6N8Q4_RHOPA|nr:DUF3325 domain-containing protein [Rhodopseudomonas palustris]OPF94152.1 hypothetical protein B1S06_09425 [Rhodopseudomonas palustris]PPQ43621.1 DUF3325 domain-containing protein [Rhodopseudomonas palustris]QQM03353.1 hypothetical protein I8G32_01894 [Rhodopseudomonas palustris]RJF62588.1 DUF3325 family protein [Rhodopseudomonas palustris]WAB79509.1 DUF3325 domain-containing protein [Rhodopseudomonas palustris]
MSHALAQALCLLGFTAFAFAMRRPQNEILRRSLRRPVVLVLRAIGACLLAIALAVVVAVSGWGFGLVKFSGHTTLAAALVYCALIGYGRRAGLRQ